MAFRSCWVTAADDDLIRLWNTEGVKFHQFNYAGGSVQVKGRRGEGVQGWGRFDRGK